MVYARYSKGGIVYYQFDKLILNNFFLYKGQEIPLSHQGTTIVSGRYKDKTMSNGAGKSLLFSGIPMLGYGNLPTGNLSAAEKTKLNLSLDFLRGKEKINVSFADRYFIKVNNKEESLNKKNTARILVTSYFPSEALFYSTCFVSQFSLVYFNLIAGTPALRAKIAKSFVNLEKLEKLKTKIKDNNIRVNKEISSLKDVSHIIETIKPEIKKLKEVTLPRITKLKKIRRELEEAISLLERDLVKMRSRYVEYKKYRQLHLKLTTKKDIDTLGKEIKWLKKEITVLASLKNTPHLQVYKDMGYPPLYKKVWDIPFYTSKGKIEVVPEEEVAKLLLKYNKLFSSITSLKKTLYSLEDMKTKDLIDCPSCGTSLTKEAISRNKQEYINRLTKDKKDLEKLKPKLRGISILRDISISVRRNITLKDIKKYWKKIDTLSTCRKNLEEHEEQLSVLTSLALLSDKPLPGGYKNKCQQRESNLEGLREHKNALDSLLASLEARYSIKEDTLFSLRDARDRYKDITSYIREDLKYLPPLTKVINSQEVYTEILYSFFEFLVTQWNVYGKYFFNTPITFEVGKERGFPSFRYKYGKGYSQDIRFMSGGERKFLTLAMIPSILSISPFRSNLLILDEMDANLDNKGFHRMLDAVSDFTSFKDSIFFITSRPIFKQSNWNNWVVQRNNSKSIVNF
jgi:DNA repair exonuclease SbcCD ATPase subunit